MEPERPGARGLAATRLDSWVSRQDQLALRLHETHEARERRELPVKPKPFSIQQRILILQWISVALALWFIAAAIYVNLRIRNEIKPSAEALSAAIVQAQEVSDALDDLMTIPESLHHQSPEAVEQEYRQAARHLMEATNLSFENKLHNEGRAGLTEMESQLFQRLDFLLRTPPDTPEAAQALQEARALQVRIERLMSSRTHAETSDLAASANRLREYTRILYLLLTAFALYAVLVARIFRRTLERNLWKPLGEILEMVRQVRKGDLNLRASTPRSVEVAPLVESMAQLAGELREMRESLERKVAERTSALEAAQKQLVQAAKLSAVGQLVSGVAHEVNNPLTSILGFAEILLDNPAMEARERKHLETIRREAVRLKGVVAGLSSFARRAPQHVARIDLRGVVQRMVELREYQLKAEDIRLHFHPPAEPVWADGDPDRLLQVLFNLVLNSEQAIQARGSGGDIWLACGCENGEAQVVVRDNGTGMQPEVMERMFEPFFTTKPVGQGTGLGLSVSLGIIEQHQGRIVAEGRWGEGTTMRVLLPAAEPPETSPSAVRSHVASMPAGGCALIIDDEEQIVDLVRAALQSHGWRTAALTDSTALETILNGEKFEAVVCDLKMPGKSGLEILDLLRKRCPELARRFLLMTGDLGDTDKQALLASHVPVLRKPFTLAQLLEAVQALRDPDR